MDVDTPAGGAFDVTSPDLRRFLSSSLANPPPRVGLGSHHEDLFTIATLSLKRTPTPSTSTSAASTTATSSTSTSSVTATKIDALPLFPLLEPLKKPEYEDEKAMDEDHSSLGVSVQLIRAHEFMLDESVEWVLDLQTCSLRKADTRNTSVGVGISGLNRSKSTEDSQGVWLSQSSAAAIASIVGVSVLEGVSPDVLGIGGGVPLITDEVHDPLGLGVNIEFSNTSGTPRYSWFDHLVCLSLAFISVVLWERRTCWSNADMPRL